MKNEKTIHDVPVPTGVNEKMVEVAKDYVTSRLKNEFTMETFLKRNGIDSKKWYYKWIVMPEYKEYIDELTNVLIPQDELEAVRKFRKKVMAYADKDSLSSAEMKLFQDLFAPIIEADIKMQMQKLGLNKEDGLNESSNKSVEEKKAILLGRLKGGN